MAKINLFDQTLKIIARNYADVFLRLAFPNIPTRLVGTLENVELALPLQWVDFVHQVQYAGQKYVFHLEFQLKHEADFPERMCTYHGMLIKQFGKKVLTLALYLNPGKKAPPNEYVARLGDVVVNRFTYPVYRLQDYVEQIRSGQYRELAPLLVTLVPNPDESVLQEEHDLILAEPDPQKRADLLALAFAIGLRDFDREIVQKIFRKELEQMKQATFIDDWLQEKLEEGIQQGIQQGRIEEAYKTIMQILSVRFNLPPQQVEPLKRQLKAIRDLTVIERFVEHAIRDYTLADFSARLGNAAKMGAAGGR